jgi:DNA helicase-2/ATP-dependent DNA helicase PcrA
MSGTSNGQHADHAVVKGLNTAQRLAVTSKADVLAILAGPGSGKTHTLTARVAWLVEHVGYEPQDIIVATFTVKAAKEMKERVTKILGEERADKIVLGTFHSIARKYIAVYGERIGVPKKFSIADDSDTKAIIKRIRERLGLNNVDISAAKEWISHRKVRGPQVAKSLSLSQSQNRAQLDEDMVKIYSEYQDHLERSDLLDYDDLLLKGAELLDRFPQCVRNVQSVLVDEYQDTNHIQFRLMKLFASARQRITIVGDPDQSIYGWRSADIKNFEHLFRDYPDHIRIALEENYRSSGSIIKSSLDVIRQDSERIDKMLTPTHLHGIQPVLRKLKTNTSEGDWIVEELQRITTLTGGMLKYQDCAILLRSAYLSRQVESALGKAGISYRMVGKLALQKPLYWRTSNSARWAQILRAL